MTDPAPRRFRNAHWPEALTFNEFLEAVPTHVRDLDSIILLVDYEEKGVRPIESVTFDPELRALVVSLG